MDKQEIVAALKRMGIEVPDDDIDRVKGLFDVYEGKLNELRAVDLSDEEVAAVFQP